MISDKRILLITTGGTIAGESAKKDSSTTRPEPMLNLHQLITPSLRRIERDMLVNVELDCFELCAKDSSDIKPCEWSELVNKIHQEFDLYDAFLITHGTNTLGYTAAALSFAFVNLGKPVVLTGSQVPYGTPGSDAFMNLENALRVAIGIQSHPITGVFLVFGSHIITGARVKKTTEFDYDAFQSFTSSSLGRIGRAISINEPNLKKHHSYLSKEVAPARNATELQLLNSFDTRIASLTEFPGLSSEIFAALVKGAGIKGVILRSFGAGDASKNILDGLKYLKEQQIPVVITSQAPNGISNFQVNEPGQRILHQHLAIPAWDMSIEAQTTKLSWLLGQQCSYNEIAERMIVDYRGEINVTSK